MITIPFKVIIFSPSILYRNGYDSYNLLHKKQVNEIANRAFITRDTNYSISDKDPSIYLPKVEEEFPGGSVGKTIHFLQLRLKNGHQITMKSFWMIEEIGLLR